jgi:hypothetical protein
MGRNMRCEKCGGNLTGFIKKVYVCKKCGCENDLVRINLGAGATHLDGWINVDWQGKQDVICDLSKEVPFRDNSVDEILIDNTLEHIPREKIFWFMDELHRICKPNAIIRIYVPHCTSPGAFGHLAHYNFFHSSSFDIMSTKVPFNYERYNKARFEIKAKLMFFHHNYVNVPLVSRLNKYINWMFNFTPLWQKIMEKANFLGFEEVYYELKVIK